MTAKIRSVTKNDISQIAPLFPTNWHFNFSAFINTHLQQSYFKGYTLAFNDTPIGFGEIFLFEKSAWLGNIVVDEKYRGKGFGKFITSHLVECGKDLGVGTFNLIATDLGKPVYENLGFEEELYYNFYSSEKKSI